MSTTPPGRGPRIAVPDRQQVNQDQITALLSIFQVLNPYVLGQRAGFLDDTEKKELSGSTKLSLEVTFMELCTRMDKVLSDDTRWNLSQQDAFYASLVKVHEAQTEFVKVQTEAARMVTLPHYKFRPTLVTIDNIFVAVYGDINTPGGYVAGRGATPREAFEDFDRAYERTPEEQLRIIAQQSDPGLPVVEVELEQAPKPQPKPRKKKL